MSLDFIPFADDPDVIEERMKSLVKPSKLDRIAKAEQDDRDFETLKRAVYKAVNFRDKFECVVCGRKGNPESTSMLDRLHHCHVVDASRGGAMATGNIFLADVRCHLLFIHGHGGKGKQLRVMDGFTNADAGLEFEIDEAAVVHVFGNREIPKHVHIVLPNGERQLKEAV
jgi:hypothetical protein